MFEKKAFEGLGYCKVENNVNLRESRNRTFCTFFHAWVTMIQLTPHFLIAYGLICDYSVGNMIDQQL